MASSDFKRFIIPGALVVGGITAGSMLAPVALAAADDDTTDAETTDSTDGADSTDAETDGRRSFRGRHTHLDHHPVAEELTEVLDMTVAEIRSELADGKSLSDIAGEQGVAVEDLEAALVDAVTERIDQALADDRIDAERAAELKDELDDRIGEMLTRTPGDGFGRHHRNRVFGGGEVAEFLGMTTDELRAAIAEGQTLAEVAEAQGVDEGDLVEFLVDQVAERLDQAVENGRLDADDVDDKLAEATERIEEGINTERGERSDGLGDRLRRRHDRRHHRGGFSDAEPTDSGLTDGELTDGELTDSELTDSGETDTDGEVVESSVDV